MLIKKPSFNPKEKKLNSRIHAFKHSQIHSSEVITSEVIRKRPSEKQLMLKDQ